jgi:hypothetical protein
VAEKVALGYPWNQWFRGGEVVGNYGFWGAKPFVSKV